MDQNNINILFSKLDEIHQALRDLTSALMTNKPAENTNTTLQNGDIPSVLEVFRETLNSIDTHNKQKTTTDKIKDNKQKISSAWNNTLHFRKLHFWQHIRNKNTAEFYESFLNSENIVIPKKFQMKPIVGEPETQTKIREEQVRANMRTEIELMKSRAVNHLEKAIKADSDLKSKIYRICDEEVRDTLYQMWEKDTKEEKNTQWESGNGRTKPSGMDTEINLRGI